MKTIVDPAHILTDGLQAIRQQFQVPTQFPDAVLAAAETAAQRKLTEHSDRTAMPFVTLDPDRSTDLDQAFSIERAGNDILLHYAIADVAWFVRDGDPIDEEAWRRGGTIYLPDGKAGLYPPVLSENAASLLPNGPRPAIIFTVRVDPAGQVRLEGAERAIIQSRAKLAYDKVQPDELPDGFADLAARINAAEAERGAARLDPPEQEVSEDGDGNFTLMFRPRLASEEDNAALSLATNLAVADALQAHGTGLFRVMEGPTDKAIKRLRHSASAFDLNWPADMTLPDFEKGLSGENPREAAFMLAIRRASNGAAYVPYKQGVTPWHAAMAATYAHATAPLRRLADRYVVQAAYAVANAQPIPQPVTDAFPRLPEIMARADMLGGQVERAAVDLAETVVMQNQIGETFNAVVTDLDERGVRMQLTDLPIVARVDANSVDPGETIKVKLAEADTTRRLLKFERVG